MSCIASGYNKRIDDMKSGMKAMKSGVAKKALQVAMMAVKKLNNDTSASAVRKLFKVNAALGLC
jgi:hypothetical protein